MLVKNLLSLILLLSVYISNIDSFAYNSLSLFSKNRKHAYYSMSMSDKYLNDLQNSVNKNSDTLKIELGKVLNSAPICNQTEIYPENIYINIQKMHSIFFNKKSTSIIFTSSRVLEDIYLYNNTFSKVTDDTKIGCKNVKSFVLTIMNENIDAILS
jgi:hypothetical protein